MPRPSWASTRGSWPVPAVPRNVIGDAIAMGVTYAVGALIGAAGI